MRLYYSLFKYCSLLFICQINSIFGQNDSIFIEKNEKGEIFFIQEVNPKQTLFSLSREFRMDIDKIISINPDHQKGLVKNKLIKLEIQKEIISQIDPKPLQRKKIYYRPNAKETSFSLLIGKLNLNWEQLKKLNPHLNQNKSTENKVILVGWLNKDQDSELTSIDSVQATAPEKSLLVSKFIDEENYRFNSSTRGLGIWEKSYQDDGKYYALHRTAKINSIIEITNPIRERKVYAKVVGRIPRHYPKNCEVVIAGEVAKDLSIANKRFFTQLRYLR